MQKQLVKDSIWRLRIDDANRYYDKWAHLFKCDTLEKYYEGFQWKKQADATYQPYTINKIYETIQIKIDQFIPQAPKYLISPRPANSSYDIEAASQSSQLKEDVLNTIVWDEREHFHDELELAYKDSFWRFGIVEVGYSADWILNPNVPKPLLNKDVADDTGKPKVKQQPEEVPVNERVYFKHIPAKRFRVGGMDHKYLNRCGWCGYYEWVYRNDLLALPGLMNRDKIEGAEGSNTQNNGFVHAEDRRSGDYVKIWHIWDNKSINRLIILDSPCITIYQKKFQFLNLLDFRPDRRVSEEGFYPIPPVWHWISAQDEINETREQLRAHRRRFIRKYQVLRGRIVEEELEKFENGSDGSLVTVETENAIQPILDAPLGPQLQEAIVTSSDDINQISGTSAELRGVADRQTATQANIINQRSGIRENADRDAIATWFSNIGRVTLLTVRKYFTLGVWARLTSDNQQSMLQEMQLNNQAYQWVSSEDLNDNYDYRVQIDVTSLSAQSQDLAKQQLLEFLAIVTQYPQVAMSPILIREVAYRVGYRNETIIKEMQKMALLHVLGTVNGIGQQMQQSGAAQQQVAQQTPNSMEKIRNQLQGQLG